jgi:hypothetical protein
MVIAVAAFLFVSLPNARAATINIGTVGSHVSSPVTIAEKNLSGVSFGNYLISGAVRANTKLTVTLTVERVYAAALEAVYGVASSLSTVSLPVYTTPTLAMAGGVGSSPVTVSKSLEIVNTGSVKEYFKAYFLYAVLAACRGGHLTVTYMTSAVPLPSALVLFGSALGGVGFFARRKKTLA